MLAGEVSGDMHGSALIRELKKLNNTVDVCGIGGNLMQNEGAYILYHINQLAFLGFVEVIKHIPFVKHIQAELIDMVYGRNIRTIVLIDYPGFNLNIAKKLKRLNVKIVYYISPQVWAWGSNRVNKIQKLVDKMIVVFPFEKEIYQKAGVDVEYVGHPLMEIIGGHKFLSKEDFFAKFQLDNTKDILLVMPGSRKQEVEKIFPDAIEAADRISKDFNMQIVVCIPQNIGERFLYKLTKQRNFTIVSGYNYDTMRYTKFGIIKSGTSTLEAAIFQLPMVIVYKTSGLTYFIGKKLIKVKNVGMANIILGEEVVPELIQRNASSKIIYEKCKEILTDKVRYSSIKEKLGAVKEKLGESGASKKAAQIINNLINGSKEN